MKIVHVITRLIRAGADENTISTCLGQAARGHDVILIHGRDHNPLFYEMLMDKITLINVETLVRPVEPLKDIKALMELVRIYKELKPDIVHTHTSKAGILGRYAAYLTGVKTVVHGVHIAPFDNVGWAERQIYLLAEKLAAPRTQAFISVSKGMRDLYLEAGIGAEDRHYVVHSGFDLQKFRNAGLPEDWRELLGIGQNEERPPVITIIGALEERKRQLEFVSELQRVVAQLPELRVLIVGEGSQRQAIEEKISALGLEKNVRLVGFRSDPEKLIALADLCVLASYREGLPRVVMQYLAAGRPCVVSALPGIEEVVSDGKNGVVTPIDDVAAAADAVCDLLTDPDKLAEFARYARETDLSSWEVSNMCNRIEEICNLVSMRPAAVSVSTRN